MTQRPQAHPPWDVRWGRKQRSVGLHAWGARASWGVASMFVRRMLCVARPQCLQDCGWLHGGVSIATKVTCRPRARVDDDGAAAAQYCCSAVQLQQQAEEQEAGKQLRLAEAMHQAAEQEAAEQEAEECMVQQRPP